MKLTSKKFLKIGGVLAAGGLLIAGVGVLLGGMTSTYIDSKGLHVYKYEEKKLDYQKIPGAIENLNIDFSLADLEIILADENGIEAVYYDESAKPQIRQEGAATTVTSKNEEEHRVILMGVGNLYGNTKVKLYLDKKQMGQDLRAKVDNGKIMLKGPRDFKTLEIENHLGGIELSAVTAESVQLKTDNGGMDIRDVTAKRFSAENHLGNIQASQIRADEGVFKNDNGNITLADSTFTALTAEDHLGDIIAEGLSIKGGQFKNDNGKIRLSGAIEGEINVSAHLGGVDIRTSIPRETASYQLSTSLGKVEVDGTQYEEAVRDENQSSTSRFIVHNNNGDIRLDFGKQ